MPELFSYPAPFDFGQKSKAERQELTRKVNRSSSGESSSGRPTKQATGSDDVSKIKIKAPRSLKGVKKLTTSSVKKAVGMVSPRRRRNRDVGSNLTGSEVDILDGFLIASQIATISNKDRKYFLQALDKELDDYC
jgi:hypothetical protein